MSVHSTQNEKQPLSLQDEARHTPADGPDGDKDEIANDSELPDQPTKDIDNLAYSHDEDPNIFMPSHEDDHEEDEDLPYPEPSTTLFHPPDFHPLFTLIEDPETDTHHHPTVHYLFSDDDPEILTAAALETLSEEQHEVEERFVVVDMSTDGKEVVATSSFSPEWQALKTRVTQAPSWGDETRAAERGLMLRIEGQESGSAHRARKKGDVDGLLRMFDEMMGGLDEALGGNTAQEQSGLALQ